MLPVLKQTLPMEGSRVAASFSVTGDIKDLSCHILSSRFQTCLLFLMMNKGRMKRDLMPFMSADTQEVFCPARRYTASRIVCKPGEKCHHVIMIVFVLTIVSERQILSLCAHLFVVFVESEIGFAFRTAVMRYVSCWHPT